MESAVAAKWLKRHPKLCDALRYQEFGEQLEILAGATGQEREDKAGQQSKRTTATTAQSSDARGLRERHRPAAARRRVRAIVNNNICNSLPGCSCKTFLNIVKACAPHLGSGP